LGSGANAGGITPLANNSTAAPSGTLESMKSNTDKSPFGKKVQHTRVEIFGFRLDGPSPPIYRPIRSNREFEPERISELNAVEMLAFDYLQLARALSLNDLDLECFARVNTLIDTFHADRSSVADVEQEIELLEATQRRFRGEGDSRPLAEDDLDWLTDAMRDRIAPMADNAEHYRQELARGREICRDEHVELTLVDEVGRARLGKIGEAEIRSAMSRPDALDEADRRFWVQILAIMWDTSRRNKNAAHYDEEAFKHAFRRTMHRTMPPQRTLEQIERYDAAIRDSIDRGIAFLERRRRARARRRPTRR